MTRISRAQLQAPPPPENNWEDLTTIALRFPGMPFERFKLLALAHLADNSASGYFAHPWPMVRS
jgi:hypothetical protein